MVSRGVILGVVAMLVVIVVVVVGVVGEAIFNQARMELTVNVAPLT